MTNIVILSSKILQQLMLSGLIYSFPCRVWLKRPSTHLDAPWKTRVWSIDDKYLQDKLFVYNRLFCLLVRDSIFHATFVPENEKQFIWKKSNVMLEMRNNIYSEESRNYKFLQPRQFLTLVAWLRDSHVWT